MLSLDLLFALGLPAVVLLQVGFRGRGRSFIATAVLLVGLPQMGLGASLRHLQTSQGRQLHGEAHLKVVVAGSTLPLEAGEDGKSERAPSAAA
jgi:hypothetical protein